MVDIFDPSASQIFLRSFPKLLRTHRPLPALRLSKFLPALEEWNLAIDPNGRWSKSWPMLNADLSGFPFEKAAMLKDLSGPATELFHLSQIPNLAPEMVYFWQERCGAVRSILQPICVRAVVLAMHQRAPYRLLESDDG